MAKKDRQFWESASMNNRTFRHYYDYLTELSMSMFEWVNMPDTIDARFLELALFGNGQAIFFKDDVMGFLALRCVASGNFDVYKVPMIRRAFADNGYNIELNNTNSVIIYNNFLRKPTAEDVDLYAKRLYNIDRTIDININAQKTPILLSCDETQRLTLLNLYKNYEGNEPVIFGDNNLKEKDAVKCITTDAPFISDKLYTLRTEIWNEALTTLGISNINITKKERLITDEVTRNMGGTIASRYSRLEARRKACKEINNMFGLDIDCRYREDFVMNADIVDDSVSDDNSEVGEMNE